MGRVSRRLPLLVLLGLVLLCSTAAAASAPLAPLLARALSVPHVAPGQSAGVAIDLEAGTVVFAQNETRSLAPASNEKLALTYALLSLLGPAFRIRTEVLGEGEQLGTTWSGDLVLKGYGDPDLTSADLRQLALQVRASGIRRVSGSIAGDETFFDASRTVAGWKPSYYIDESPPLSALSVDRGIYHGLVARDPPLAAAARFQEELRAAGVVVAGRPASRAAASDALPLATISSRPLTAIVRFMDRESDNFTAELLLKQLGALAADSGTSAAGARVVMQELASANVPLAGVRVVDGSGLSLLDRLTAQALVGILQAAWIDPDVRPTLVQSLAVAGVNGTLQDRMRRAPARGNVLAKTGTTNVASALSGYVRGRYAFAIVQNGHPISAAFARLAQDRFAGLLAAQ